jgi:hypothetical protein
MMYKGLKDNLKKKILLVFNKVDECYTPRNEALYSKEFFVNKKSKLLVNCSVRKMISITFV